MKTTSCVKKMKIEVEEEEEEEGGYLVGGRWGTEAKTEAGCGGWSSVMSSGSDVMWEESIQSIYEEVLTLLQIL